MTHSPKAQIRSMLADLGKWWHDRRGNRSALTELRNCPREELHQIALDIGASEDELRALAARWPDSTNLLSRRLNTLGLNGDNIARRHPAVANDLRRLCSLCQRKGECEHDLDSNPAHPRWRRYCPNQSTLEALREGQGTPSRKRKQQ